MRRRHRKPILPTSNINQASVGGQSSIVDRDTLGRYWGTFLWAEMSPEYGGSIETQVEHAAQQFLSPEADDTLPAQAGALAFILGCAIDGSKFTVQSPRDERNGKFVLRTSGGIVAEHITNSINKISANDGPLTTGEGDPLSLICDRYNEIFNHPELQQYFSPLSPTVVGTDAFAGVENVPFPALLFNDDYSSPPGVVFKGSLRQFIGQQGPIGFNAGFLHDAENDRPAGIVNYRVIVTPSHEVMVNRSIYLLPEYQGMGIGPEINKFTDRAMTECSRRINQPVMLCTRVRRSNDRSLTNARKIFGEPIGEDDEFFHFKKAYNPSPMESSGYSMQGGLNEV